jgi:hypothetical protein
VSSVPVEKKSARIVDSREMIHRLPSGYEFKWQRMQTLRLLSPSEMSVFEQI